MTYTSNCPHCGGARTTVYTVKDAERVLREAIGKAEAATSATDRTALALHVHDAWHATPPHERKDIVKFAIDWLHNAGFLRKAGSGEGQRESRISTGEAARSPATDPVRSSELLAGSATVPPSAPPPPTPSAPRVEERTDSGLTELVEELHTRCFLHSMSRELHEAWLEARTELLTRFAALRQQLAAAKADRSDSEALLRQTLERLGLWPEDPGDADASEHAAHALTVLSSNRAAEVEGVVENDGKIYTRRESGTNVSHNPLPFPPGTSVLVRPVEPSAVRRLAERR